MGDQNQSTMRQVAFTLVVFFYLQGFNSAQQALPTSHITVTRDEFATKYGQGFVDYCSEAAVQQHLADGEGSAVVDTEWSSWLNPSWNTFLNPLSCNLISCRASTIVWFTYEEDWSTGTRRSYNEQSHSRETIQYYLAGSWCDANTPKFNSDNSNIFSRARCAKYCRKESNWISKLAKRVQESAIAAANQANQ